MPACAPAKVAKAAELSKRQQELLARRRNPVKGKAKKQALETYPIVIGTGTFNEAGFGLHNSRENGRDINIRVNARNSVEAVSLALEYVNDKIRAGEFLCSIRIGEPE